MKHGSNRWVVRHRAQFARALASCCAAFLLAGSLSVTQGNLAPEWTMPHCPQGQTQGSQQSHNHCAWHCGGLDIQGGGARGEIFAELHVSRVWKLGHIPLQDAIPEGEFPPRGPPHVVRQNA